MKIKVNKSLAQVAKEFAKARNFDWEPKLLENGEFVAFRPDSSTAFGRQFCAEWEASAFPFGEKNWRHLWSQFGRWVRTEENSVHRGAELPDDGIAVLMVEDGGSPFAVVCQQWITDRGWWDWEWHPVAILARA